MSWYKSIPKAANILTVIAFIGLAIKASYLNQIPSPYIWMVNTGPIVEGVLCSIIASYIFFLFVVHIREESDRHTIAPYLDKHIARIIGECNSQLGEISKAAGISLSFEILTLQDVSAAFTQLSPYSNAPLLLAMPATYANWLQYLEYHNQRTKECIKRVLDQSRYLTAQQIALLTAIDDCSHFHSIKLIQFQKINNLNMAPFASLFFDYCNHCNELRIYYDNN